MVDVCPHCGDSAVEYDAQSDTFIPCTQGCTVDTTDSEEGLEIDLDDEIDHWDEEDQEDLFFPDDEDVD